MEETKGYRDYCNKFGNVDGIQDSLKDLPLVLNPFSYWLCPDVVKYGTRFGKYLESCAYQNKRVDSVGWVGFNNWNGLEYESHMAGVKSKDYKDFVSQCREKSNGIMT